MQSLFISILIVLTGTVIHAQQLFSPSDYNAWDGTGLQFGTIPAAPGATFSQITRGSGNYESTDPDGILALSWNSASSSDAIATNRYFTFRVSADASTTVTVDSLFLVLKRNNSGPSSCIVQYKSPATGYAYTDIGGTYTVLNPSTNLTIIPPAALTATPTDSIVFRVVGWGGTHPMFGAFGILNGTHVYGSVTPTVASETISAATVSGNTPLCITPTVGQAIQVDFTSTGTFNAGNSYTLELSDNTGSFSSPLAVGSLSSTANSGTINATIPAGTATGNYQLRISSSDPAVTGLDTTDIDLFSGLTLSASMTQPLCNADPGAIDLTPSGGTTPLVFDWSNTAVTEDLTGLGPDTYVIEVTDANGCTASDSYVINSVPAISVSETITNLMCNGDTDGSISVVVTGGTGSMDYAWTGTSETTNTLSGIGAGNYELTVTDDNNCTSVQNYSVSEPDALTFSESITDALCNGENNGGVSIAVTGGTAGYTYAWTGSSETSNSLVGVTAGSYEVTVTDDNGCTLSETYTVSEPDALVLTEDIVHATCATCQGSVSITVTGGNGPYTYLWDDNSENSSINGTPGQYCVEVTDNNGCTTDACFDIGSTASLAALDTDALNVYPNPASDMIYFSGTQPGQLTIRNLHGQAMEVVKIQDTAHALPLSSWESGVYFYVFQADNGTVQNGRFVKQ